MDNGGIIVGLKGEKICNYFSFYAVFKEEENYSVLSPKGEIGTLNDCPKIGNVFTLAGAAWMVVSVDEERKKVYVQPTQSSSIPTWTGEDGDIHTKIVQRVKRILQEDTVYPYLLENAKKILSDARKVAKESGFLEHDIIRSSGKSYCLCPWVGTKELRTIERMFSYGLRDQLGISGVDNCGYYLNFTSTLGAGELEEKLKNFRCEEISAPLVLDEETAPRIDKYDYMVPEELLRAAYVHNQVDIGEAVNILNNLSW